MFDMNSDFGPSTGYTRKERWLVAERCGKSPPKEVWMLLQVCEVQV
jgi:hypothetical protein